MPFTEVLGKFKRGTLHSGSASGPKVTNRKQAIAIRMSEQRKASEGKTEYQPKGGSKRGQKPKPRGFASIPFKKGR